MLQVPQSFSSSSILEGRSNWPVFILCIFAVYLSCTMTIPFVGKLASGLLLLLGFVGLYRLKNNFYSLRLEEKWLLGSFLLFSSVSIVSYFYWPQTRESRMHLEDYVTFMMLVPLYLLLRQICFNFTSLVVVLAVVAIELGVLSLLSDHARPSGAVNPMRYGAISLILAVIPLIGILLVRNSSLAFKMFLLLSAGLGFIACFLTQSRGGVLAIPVLAFMCCVYLYRTGNPKFLMVFLVGSVLVGIVVSQQPRVKVVVISVERYFQGDSGTALGARFDMFKAAGILIKQSPIFGSGLYSYSSKASEIRKNTPGMSFEVGVWANPHNEILQVMVEKGVIGLVTLLLLFAAPGYLFLQALRNAADTASGRQVKFYAMSGLSVLIVYAVAGQSVALFEHDVFNHFFALVILLFASQIRVIGYLGGAELAVAQLGQN